MALYLFSVALVSGLVFAMGFQTHRLKLELKNKDKSLKMIEDRMAAIELAGDGIGIAESDGRLSFVNQAFVDVYGFSSWQGMVGRRWIDFCADETRKVLENDVLIAIATGGCWNGVGVGVRRNQTEFMKSISVSALPGRRWVLIIRDIGDMIKTEELSKQRLAAIEAAGDGIGLVDPAGNLVYMNRALKALHELDEYEAQDHIGHPWADLYTDLGREQIDRIVIPSLKEAGYWQGESPILTKTGQVAFAEMSLTLLPDGGLIGTARNITDRVRAEQERVELEKKFYQAQKMDAVGRLAGGIAHDFNNILAAMMGYAEFLIEDLPTDSRSAEYARLIHSGGTQARDVVDRLLMFSRTHDHKKEPLDLRQKIVETISILRSSIPSTIAINIDLADSEMMVSGNKTLISQAVMNLCVNARDAIGDHHGSITINITAQTYQPLGPDYLVLGHLEQGAVYYGVRVADTGCGMDMQTMERIFDPFFTTKPADQGTGLGLSSVHGVMVSHDGAVAVRSQQGMGTEFILFFPELLNPALAIPFSAAVIAPVSMAACLNILIVDDQPDVCFMLDNLLTRMGHHPESCADGAGALEKLAGAPDYFNLVITDQTMPGMTGCELADRIAVDYKTLPVILMSGFSVDNLNALVRSRAVIVATLRKPIDRNELTRAINRAVLSTRKTA